jgi:predicted kinase
MAETEPRTTVYMLCGFVGSGKTTYARILEAGGVVRLSIDELVFERHGRHGVDYDESEYPTHHAAALADLDEQLRALLAQRRPVVLDYGFWSREMHDRYKRLINSCGGHWRLLYFDVDLQEIRRRLDERNHAGGANALVVTERHLEEFLTRWQPPADEGEERISPLPDLRNESD